MASEKIKAIVFDCFGVLIDESFGAFIDNHFSDNPEKKEQAKRVDTLYCLGKLSGDHVISEFSKLADISREECIAEVSKMTINYPLLDIVKSLKSTYKTGFLSNAGENPLEVFFDPEHAELFDAVSISFESGFVKPEAGAFEDVAGKLGVRMDECIFIDDRLDYCEGARNVGMQAVQYKGVETLNQQLKKLGVSTISSRYE